MSRAEIEAAGLDPARLISAKLIERVSSSWQPPECEHGCMPGLDYDTRRDEGLVGVSCVNEPACLYGVEWHRKEEIEAFSTCPRRVFGALRHVAGLEPLDSPTLGGGILAVGVLARRGKRVPVVWKRTDFGAFPAACRAARAALGGDGLIVLVSRPGSTTPVLHTEGIAVLDVPLHGDLALWRGLDLLDPAYRQARVTDANAIFDDVRIEFAEEPGARHVVRINGREYGGFQRSDLKFLRLLLLAAKRKAEPDIDEGGWLHKPKLEGDPDRALEDVRAELRSHEHQNLTADERVALVKGSGSRVGHVRLAVPPTNIGFDESLAQLAFVGAEQSKPTNGKALKPGDRKRAADLAKQNETAMRLLAAARALGVPGPQP